MTKRIVLQGAGFDKSLRHHCKDKTKDYAKALKQDLTCLISLLQNAMPIPDRYKMHKLESKRDVYDCHLLSRGSDDLVFFRKYKEGGKSYIKLIAVGTHTLAHRLNASVLEASVIDDLLGLGLSLDCVLNIDEDDLLIDPDDA